MELPIEIRQETSVHSIEVGAIMLVFSVHYLIDCTRIDLHPSVFQKHVSFLMLCVSIHPLSEMLC